MGEIQIKYEEKLSALKYDNQMIEINSDQERVYLHDISGESVVLINVSVWHSTHYIHSPFSREGQLMIEPK